MPEILDRVRECPRQRDAEEGAPPHEPGRPIEQKPEGEPARLGMGAYATQPAPEQPSGWWARPAAAVHFPKVALATAVVMLVPIGAAWELRSSGLLSTWLAAGVAMVLSFLISSLGSVYWAMRCGSGDVVFSELLLWGWLRRWRNERQLKDAVRLLGSFHGQDPERDAPQSVQARAEALRQLAAALEAQDLYLNGHSRRVGRHAAMIARGLGLPRSEVAKVRAAAAIHDVGKLHVPPEILNKPGRLSEEEFEVVKSHAARGSDMVATLGDPELTAAVRHHHERMDGRGYPDGLSGESIPPIAKIIAVADTFDAITSMRPYRAPARHKEALDILRKSAGTQLDEAAVKAFLRHYAGRRRFVLWALLTVSPQRALARTLLHGGGSPALAGKLAVSAATAVAVGTTAGLAHPLLHSRSVHRPPAPTAASPATAAGGSIPVDSRPAASTGADHSGSPGSAGAKRSAGDGLGKSLQVVLQEATGQVTGLAPGSGTANGPTGTFTGTAGKVTGTIGALVSGGTLGGAPTPFPGGSSTATISAAGGASSKHHGRAQGPGAVTQNSSGHSASGNGTRSHGAHSQGHGAHPQGRDHPHGAPTSGGNAGHGESGSSQHGHHEATGGGGGGGGGSSSGSQSMGRGQGGGGDSQGQGQQSGGGQGQDNAGGGGDSGKGGSSHGDHGTSGGSGSTSGEGKQGHGDSGAQGSGSEKGAGQSGKKGHGGD